MLSEIATILAIEMIRKSGVRAWEADTETRLAITAAALEMATALSGSEAAMASKFLLDEMDGTPAQICFADFAGDFSPTIDLRHASATDVECQLSLASVAATPAARQSAKVDLGALRATAYKVRCAFEIAATPTAGRVISLYWNPSQHATAGTANNGNCSGTDAAYTGYSSNLAASLPHLDFIGNFVVTAQAAGTVQIGVAGILVPAERYGSLVVVNDSGAALDSDDIQMHVVFDPLYIEGQ